MQLLGGPLNDSNQVIKAKAILVAVSVVAVVVVDAEVEVAVIIQFYEVSVLRIGSPLGREKLTPAYWAGVVVVKPSGDAARADEMVAWKAD